MEKQRSSCLDPRNASSRLQFQQLEWERTGSYSGTNNPASITMNGPITETATFTQNLVQVTVQTNPAGLAFSVDGTTYSSTQTFSWVPGSSHTIATTSPQSGGTRCSVRLDKLERWRRYLTQCRAYHQHDLHGKLHDAILPDYGSRNRWHSDSS